MNGSGFVGQLANVDPGFAAGILFELRERQLNGAVTAAAGGKHRLEPAQRFVQIDVHVFVDCKRTHAAHVVAVVNTASSSIIAARITIIFMVLLSLFISCLWL